MRNGWVTTTRKRRFADATLSATQSLVGLADVGAGGPLKAPWTMLPANHVRKFEFEPEEQAAAGVPLCVSDRNGTARLLVGADPRASSLHPPALRFVERYANDGIMTVRELDVECLTLDSYFAGRLDVVDVLDINAEGHDFRVLEGARTLLIRGAVSLIKIEVLFTEVWHGQGWFSDIDHCLRCAGYDLVTLELDFERPAAVRAVPHDGELLWGKAFYVPAADTWNARLRRWDGDAVLTADRVLKAVTCYALIDAPGRALELIDAGERSGALKGADDLRRRIRRIFTYAELEGSLRALDVMRLGRCLGRLAVRR